MKAGGDLSPAPNKYEVGNVKGKKGRQENFLYLGKETCVGKEWVRYNLIRTSHSHLSVQKAYQYYC